MFTGLIEEIGDIKEIIRGSKSGKLKIGCCKILEGIKLGDSISVNGICLTVTNFNETSFDVDVMPETIKVTSLESLAVGSKVNLERAMKLGDRFGGHIVSGHIDGTGRLISFKEKENATEVRVEANESLMKYIIKKGSIAIDGASLTIADLDKRSFMVSIIPHTKKETILLTKKVGELVNLECDSVGKYIERLMEFQSTKSGGLTEELLNRYGFM